MSMDISSTIQPDSSQINADDLISQPITVTVESVSKGNAEQPVNINTVETPGRAYRPSKTMRKLIVHAWGADASQYVGRRLTLFRNPDIMFGKEKVGGIEISAMSHIDKPISVSLTVSRGRKRTFKVDVLQAAPPTDWQALLQDAQGDRDKLLALHHRATNENAPQDILDAIIQAGQQATQPEGEQ